jgi:hypothetical protein
VLAGQISGGAVQSKPGGRRLRRTDCRQLGSPTECVHRGWAGSNGCGALAPRRNRWEMSSRRNAQRGGASDLVGSAQLWRPPRWKSSVWISVWARRGGRKAWCWPGTTEGSCALGNRPAGSRRIRARCGFGTGKAESVWARAVDRLPIGVLARQARASGLAFTGEKRLAAARGEEPVEPGD